MNRGKKRQTKTICLKNEKKKIVRKKCKISLGHYTRLRPTE